MAEATKIVIDNNPVGTFRMVLRHGLIWAYLVGAEAAAHLMFGGSWVIDLMVLAVMCLLICNQAMSASGMIVRMTPAEIRLWVAAGMPNDVKAWRDTRKLAEAA